MDTRKLQRVAAVWAGILLLLLCPLGSGKAAEKEAEQTLAFEEAQMEAVFGEEEGVLSKQQVSGVEAEEEPVVYELEEPGKGICCDASDGTVWMEDAAKCGQWMEENGGTVQIKVKAHQGEVSAEYTIHLVWAAEPKQPCRITGGTKGEEDWYLTEVRVAPGEEAYEIAAELPADRTTGFAREVVFTEEGALERFVYLRNTQTGGITGKVSVGRIKIDQAAPEMLEISYAPAAAVSQKEAGRTFDFYDMPVTITFRAVDTGAGVSTFVWCWEEEKQEKEQEKGMVKAICDPEDPTVFYGNVTLPGDKARQLRGQIKGKAVDMAGLESEEAADGHTVIVDTISPQLTVEYRTEAGTRHQTVGTREYYSGAVDVVLQITETNFYPEDICVQLSVNGAKASPVEGLLWKKTEHPEQYEAIVSLEKDGDYQLLIDYRKRMAHREGVYQPDFTAYISNLLTIDTIRPEISFTFRGPEHKKKPQTAVLQIREHNFTPEMLQVKTEARDITGAEIKVQELEKFLQDEKNWNNKGDLHTLIMFEENQEFWKDARYRMQITCQDPAFWMAEEVDTEEFIIDHRAPEASTMKVTYSEPIRQTGKSGEKINYYNPKVCVTFSVRDRVAGVEFFTWMYRKAEGESESNVREYAPVKVKAVQDTTDPSLFTASVLLPKKEADQIRGRVAFTATDRCGNQSKKRTDTEQLLVVDTIAPRLQVEYTPASRRIRKTCYYKEAVGITLLVTEANFQQQDVIVEISKDKGDFIKMQPSWKRSIGDTYVGACRLEAPKDHSKDGVYILRVSYTDRSSNRMKSYRSHRIIVDTKKPVLQVSHKDTGTGSRTSKICIMEKYFREEDVKLRISTKDVSGKEKLVETLYQKGEWRHRGEEHTLYLTYLGDARYTFDIDYIDPAGNMIRDYPEESFTVDQTPPKSWKLTYSKSVLETILQGISFGFYRAQVTVKAEAVDEVSGIRRFYYSFAEAGKTTEQVLEGKSIHYSTDRKTASVKFQIPVDAVKKQDVRGSVQIRAEDWSGNQSDWYTDQKQIVVDRIAPNVTAAYSEPVKQVDEVVYYDRKIRVALMVKEANFFEEDVKISVDRNGSLKERRISWKKTGAETYLGVFWLRRDGDYRVQISYTDKSGNRMETYTSQKLILDTKISEPIIRINGKEGDGKAFSGEVIPEIYVKDRNFESYSLQLVRTRCYEQQDVTEVLMNQQLPPDQTGAGGCFAAFPEKRDTDGIYTLTVEMTDMVGHRARKQITFTVNRYGSVYRYAPYVQKLTQTGDRCVQSIEQDLCITEYNADQLVEGSTLISISRDGRPLSDICCEILPAETASVGDSGWYQYEYRISKENFQEDGSYKIAVSSKDQTGNDSETGENGSQLISFLVDATAPELTSVTGLEKKIIHADRQEVDFTVYDTMGLKTVRVLIDGKEIQKITQFSEDASHYEGSFLIRQSKKPQTVRIMVEDLAGNMIDTDAKAFTSVYSFEKRILLSTNVLVCLWAEPWYMIVIVAVSVLVLFILQAGKRKK